jgi:ApeA N-terminal domain 1
MSDFGGFLLILIIKYQEQRWLNIHDNIKHICDLYFGIKYADFMYGEQRFYSIVQALESYHRIQIVNEQTSKEDHEHKLKEIYESIPSRHLDWLKNKLHFSNEPNLKDRIEYLVDFHNQVVDPFIKNRDNFLKKVRDTRNYYTHYDRSLDNKFAKGEELFRLTQILSFLLQSCLLKELGCTPDRCAELISKDKKYRYAIEAVKQSNFQW